MINVKICVYGLVQGVGFRYCTKIVADQLEIAGIVRNQNDGSVYIEAQGTITQVKKFIAKIKDSPTPSGRVERITVKELPVKEYHGFKVTY
ncbi:MAG: acylphosphatase [Liquorilactobacillus nagelii]|jgi:acylphosphatase|uniref:acylphosphatase n=1 Tax=Liquorilactobacillus nagelii TaxID=82688 RepID=A0A3Q8CP74_9LACO|nr:acylphosphatase [Liquorilactobacillus nagelii]AUJ32298.1 acylphosphatase [Liquorilactobacillus nagelii]KRL40690.1 hypothetical protein FD45_GL001331 [Liquorilactobacillus nagelii DSM 13675]MCC7615474.1 acylphosphatase [Liquorilactobacillus nagelii]MCI1634521.1 acylphosphatase [Liquorilactobacillus nagelii]MCI1699417.1 acylphosphatase [Liquorilactobacillus nagelii]